MKILLLLIISQLCLDCEWCNSRAGIYIRRSLSEEILASPKFTNIMTSPRYHNYSKGITIHIGELGEPRVSSVAAITYICTMAAVYSQEIFWFGSVGDWNVVLWWKWLFDTPSPGIERRLEPRSHSSKWQTRGMTTEGIATPFKPLTYSGHQAAMVNGPSW